MNSGKENDKVRIDALIVGILMLTSTMGIIVFATDNASAVPTIIGLRCGDEYVGMGNVTYLGVNLERGCLVEVIDNSTGIVQTTFNIGDGTEGPPGTFKDGHFDVTITLMTEDMPMDIFLRAYDNDTIPSSTTFGDSILMSIAVPGTYEFPGWNLLAADSDDPVSEVDWFQFINSMANRTITATASDNTSSVQFVEFWHRYAFLPDIVWNNWTLYGTDITEPYSIEYDWPNGEGNYEFYSIAVDNAGNRELPPSSADVPALVDSVPANSSINPVSPYWHNTSPLTLTTTTDWSVARIEKVLFNYSYSSDNTSWDPWVNVYQVATWPYSHDFTFPAGPGYYKLYTVAIDQAGNIEPEPLYDVLCGYDIISPNSSVDPIIPYWHSTSPLVITANATDDLSGVDYLELLYSFEGGLYNSFGYSTAPYSWDFTFPSGAGNYTFYTIATDIANNSELAPGVEDASAGYDNIAPFITSTIPFDGEMDVSTVAGVYTVEFSEPMDQTVTAFNTDLPGAVGFWLDADTLEIFYNPLVESTLYYVDFSGMGHQDTTGNALTGDMYKNFTTAGVNPEVITTTPLDGAIDVPLAAGTYVIEFSEPMDTFVGIPITDLPLSSPWVWSANGMWLNATYNMLTESTTYNVDVSTGGFQDLAGNPLIQGSYDWTFDFTTIGLNPEVIITSPLDGATGVALAAGTYVIEFSESMMLVGLPITDLPGASDFWFDADTLWITYNALTESTTYNVDLNGGGFQDLAGNPLILGGYGWTFSFTTVGVNPEVTSTTPLDGAVGVSTVADIYVIEFSEPMMAVGAVTTDLPLSSAWTWSANGMWLNASYNVLADFTTYNVDLNGGGFQDVFGNPLVQGGYDWTFDFTTGDFTNPTITSTIPFDGEIDVSTAAGTYIIEFSEPINLLGYMTNLPVDSASWFDADTYHINYTALTENTLYYVDVWLAEDFAGNPLVGDDYKVFTTGDFTAPTITSTIPADLAPGVSTAAGTYIIEFSESMDQTITAFQTNLPGAIGFWWDADTFWIDYNALTESTMYYVDLTSQGHQDLTGIALTDDMYKEFTTGDFINPIVISTSPVDGAVGVSTAPGVYRIQFSEPMMPVGAPITDLPGISWTWDFTNTWLEGTYNVLAESTTYFVDVSVGFQDVNGNPLDPPIFFTFTTGDSSDPISQVDTIIPYWNSAPITITATASDAGSGVDYVELFYRYAIDNSSWGLWTSLGTDLSSPWSWPFGFPDGEGYYEFYSIATDNAANVENAPLNADAMAALDVTVPMPDITQPIDGSFINGLVTVIAVDLSGATDIVDAVFEYYDGFTWNAIGTDANGTDGWSFDWDTTPFSGSYFIRVTMSDIPGNTGTDTISVFIDNLAPTSSAGPLPTYVNTLTFDVPYTAIDNPNPGGCGVDTVDLYWKFDGSPTWNYYGTFMSSPISFTAGGGGPYKFFTIARDFAGNTEAMKVIEETEIMIDLGAPMAPANLRVYVHDNGTSTLSWGPSASVDFAYYNVYVSTNPNTFDFGMPVVTNYTGTSWFHISGGNPAFNYYYIVRAVDLAGNEDQNTDAVGKYVLSLNSGWNLVSTPLLLWDNSLESVFGKNLTGSSSQTNSDRIFHWTGSSWSLAYMYEVGDPIWDGTWLFSGGSFDIQPDVGYFVYINDVAGNPAQVINLTGDVPGQRSVSISVGWNLVGYTSLTPVTLQYNEVDNASGLFNSGFTGGYSQPESDLIFTYDGSTYENQYMYKNGGPPWDGTWLGTTFDLTPGSGYWIEVRDFHTGFTWTYG